MNSIASRACAAVLALSWALGSAFAGEAPPAAADPALEKRVNSLAAELRCLVCQNQSLADSNASLAVDLKNQIRDRLQKGESESQIIDFMVARYGDFVLYRPPVKGATLLLWFGPLLLLLAGVFVLLRRLKRRAAVETEISDADRAKAARLLESGEATRK